MWRLGRQAGFPQTILHKTEEKAMVSQDKMNVGKVFNRFWRVIEKPEGKWQYLLSGAWWLLMLATAVFMFVTQARANGSWLFNVAVLGLSMLVGVSAVRRLMAIADTLWPRKSKK